MKHLGSGVKTEVVEGADSRNAPTISPRPLYLKHVISELSTKHQFVRIWLCAFLCIAAQLQLEIGKLKINFYFKN